MPSAANLQRVLVWRSEYGPSPNQDGDPDDVWNTDLRRRRPQRDYREIDTGTPPTRFARGWHCLGLIEEFTDGKPHSVEVFGTKLVVGRRRRTDQRPGRLLPAYGRRSVAGPDP